MNSATRKSQDSPRWALLGRLYEEGAALQGEERDAFLSRHQVENPDLIDELKDLLASSGLFNKFLEPTTTNSVSDLFDRASDFKSLPQGTEISGFRIQGILGSGSFATVYLAEEIALGRKVALKISTASTQEARTIAALDHRSIVQVFSGHADAQTGLKLICMQWVRGPSLQKLLEILGYREFNGENILNVIDEVSQSCELQNVEELFHREALRVLDEVSTILFLGVQICDSLSYSHSRNVLHLDVKPGNILLNHCGIPMLTDFNVSVRRTADLNALPLQFGGTPDFMSPEQQAIFETEDKAAAFQKIDARSDVYSLGKVLRELIQRGEGRNQRKQSDVNSAVDLSRALAAKPEKRFASAAEFGRALKNSLELRAIEKSLPPRKFLGELSERHPLVSLTLIGALPQLIAVLIGLTYNAVEIVGGLTEAQHQAWLVMNAWYLPVSSALILAFWIFIVSRFYPFLKAPKDYVSDSAQVERLKMQALLLPYWGVLCSSLGWLPGCLFYPLWIHLWAGPINPGVALHFMSSFVLSWAIALSYSFVFHQYIVVRDVYPRFWVGGSENGESSRRILAGAALGTRICLAVCILSPLVGALGLLGFGAHSPQVAEPFRLLIASLIVLGIVGVLFSISVGVRLVQCFTFFSAQIGRVSRPLPPQRTTSPDWDPWR